MPVLTLAQAKQQLNIDASDTSEDEEIQEYVDAITRPVEGMVGPVDDREVVERLTGGGPTLALSTTPVVALASLVYLDGYQVDVDQVAVDRVTGEVAYTAGPWCRFPRGSVSATYTAGRGGACPENVNLAARIILQHLWRTQRGRMSTRVYGDTQDDMVTAPGFGFLIPNRAYELLRPDERGPTAA